ncbi:RND family efflux pump membrane fusion protein [Thermotomaculum hydrothermale]|uniref:RND family efflux pump membrane fusion protein n=1 Tax=Thermotomaculum hydrothermale TaxID=981385 RepID=A0A7R6PLW5_9BACT|nr:efflux RND transporter periplasmic adaptor subunit [Thermotomaculum hydrothermale]BBB32497.1 RND family efflux pump membrane fusion protein [Thermotomaculum hydrothermale]
MKKVLLFSIFALILVSCSKNDVGELKQLPPVKTKFTKVEKVVTSELVEAPGQVTSIKDAYIMAKSIGTILNIQVKAGDFVKKGQSLLTIDSSDIKSKLQQAKGALAQAEAALTIAKNNYERFKELYKRNACSKVELEQMEFQYNKAKGAVEMAKGAVNEAKAYLKYSKVVSPFDAIVVERMVNIGDFAAPGRPLLRIIDPKDLRFECTIGESDAKYIKKGDKVSVKLDSLPEKIEGEVAEISGGSDFLTHTVTVRIAIPFDERLKAGMYGVAYFNSTPKQRIFVPEKCILKRGELNIVYVVDKNNIAKLTLVRLGKKFGDKFEVLSGLKGDETVACSNLSRISDGVKLEEM